MRTSRGTAALIIIACALPREGRAAPPPPVQPTPPVVQAVPVVPPAPIVPPPAPPKSLGIVALPTASYSPETDLGFGAFGMLFFHAGQATRVSFLRSTFMYTTKGQMLADNIASFWLFRDQLRASWNLAYANFPNFYFGIGNETPGSSQESYTEKSLQFVPSAQVRVVSSLYLGVQVRLDSRDITRDPAGRLTVEQAVATGGGFTSGVGPRVSWDSRNNVTSASQGAYVDASYMLHGALFGSDFRFSQLHIDVRKYFPIWSDDHVLAFQLFGSFSVGQTPFYLLPQIGGDRLRGIFFGRYRDNIATQGQMEYRFPVFWRLGGTAFIGAGQVARSLDSLSLGLHPGVGAGLRILVNQSEKLNLRADVAYSDGLAFYVNFGEAF